MPFVDDDKFVKEKYEVIIFIKTELICAFYCYNTFNCFDFRKVLSGA